MKRAPSLIPLAAARAGRPHSVTPQSTRDLPLPGNDYTNDAQPRSAANAAAGRSKAATITVIQGTRVRRRPPAPARPRRRPRGRPAGQRVDPSEQRARDSDARAHPRGRTAKAEERAWPNCRRNTTTASPSGWATSTQLPEVPRPRRRTEGQHRAQGKRHRRASSASSASCRRSDAARPRRRSARRRRRLPQPLPALRPAGDDGRGGRRRRPLLFANAALRERARHVAPQHAARLGSSTGSPSRSCCATRVAAVSSNEFADQLRYDAHAAPPGQASRAVAGARDRDPDRQARATSSSSWSRSSSRPGRTARSALLDQAQANKELIRNLAHEIKNPLGGIRGAAQLLEMEIESRDADRVHPGHHPRGRPAADAWSTGCWRRTAGRTWWATSTSTRSASACAR